MEFSECQCHCYCWQWRGSGGCCKGSHNAARVRPLPPKHVRGRVVHSQHLRWIDSMLALSLCNPSHSVTEHSGLAMVNCSQSSLTNGVRRSRNYDFETRPLLEGRWGSILGKTRNHFHTRLWHTSLAVATPWAASVKARRSADRKAPGVRGRHCCTSHAPRMGTVRSILPVKCHLWNAVTRVLVQSAGCQERIVLR